MHYQIMKDVDLLQSAMNLVLTIPVWAVIGYFAVRSNNKRDKFEEQTTELLHSLDKRTAIIEKESEFNRIFYHDVNDIKETIKKINTDLNIYYKRLKDIESQSDRR